MSCLVGLWDGRLPAVMAVGSWWEDLKVLEGEEEEEEKEMNWVRNKEEKEERIKYNFLFILNFCRMLVPMNRGVKWHIIFIISVCR